MDEDVRRSHEAGFERHLTKPVNLQRLQEAIREVAAREAPEPYGTVIEPAGERERRIE
jgi:CheY-like chemotaxis protein